MVMPVVRFFKVNELPEEFAASALYFVADGEDKMRIYLSDENGTSVREAITGDTEEDPE
jgi:hypothetical protein